MNKKIYGIADGAHLGDIWLIASGAILLSRENKSKVYISKYPYSFENFEINYNNNYEGKIKECLDLLDSFGAEIEIVDEPQNQHNESTRSFTIPESALFCKNSAVPTKLKQNLNNINKISLQIESKFYNQNKGIYEGTKPNWIDNHRNMSLDFKNDIYRKMLCLKNYKVSIVGEHEGELVNSIKTLSESKIFIGITSGMAHIATSIGIPTYIYYWEWKEQNLSVLNWHQNKNIQTFKTIDDILNILNKHEIY
jgi:hypothetical protein